MKLKVVDLSEVHELEPAVMASIPQIEEGLRLLDHQLPLGDQGRPDIVAVDTDGSLVILELKCVTAGLSAVDQVSRYYEWSAQNVPLIARVFPEVKPDERIRLIVIAPAFDESAVRLARYLDLNLSLIKYIAVMNDADEVGLVFDEVDLNPVEEDASQFRSVDDIIGYIAEDSVREDFKKVLSDVVGLGVEIVPYKGGKRLWLECRLEGEDAAYFQTRKKCFRCQYFDNEKEDYIRPPIKCADYSTCEKDIKQLFVSSIKELKGES